METNEPKTNPPSTWLEIAVGAILLSVLSMMVVPCLTRAAGEGRICRLSETLYLIRCTLDLYRNEHNGLYPGQKYQGDSVSSTEFIRDLTMPDSKGNYTYFQQVPANPFITQEDRRNTVTCVNDPNATPDGSEGTAWWFNAATGEFRGCDNQFHTAY